MALHPLGATLHVDCLGLCVAQAGISLRYAAILVSYAGILLGYYLVPHQYPAAWAILPKPPSTFSTSSTSSTSPSASTENSYNIELDQPERHYWGPIIHSIHSIHPREPREGTKKRGQEGLDHTITRPAGNKESTISSNPKFYNHHSTARPLDLLHLLLHTTSYRRHNT